MKATMPKKGRKKGKGKKEKTEAEGTKESTQEADDSGEAPAEAESVTDAPLADGLPQAPVSAQETAVQVLVAALYATDEAQVGVAAAATALGQLAEGGGEAALDIGTNTEVLSGLCHVCASGRSDSARGAAAKALAILAKSDASKVAIRRTGDFCRGLIHVCDKAVARLHHRRGLAVVHTLATLAVAAVESHRRIDELDHKLQDIHSEAGRRRAALAAPTHGHTDMWRVHSKGNQANMAALAAIGKAVQSARIILGRALQEELLALELGALQQRATQKGVSEAQIGSAVSKEQQKEALVKLLLATPSTTNDREVDASLLLMPLRTLQRLAATAQQKLLDDEPDSTAYAAMKAGVEALTNWMTPATPSADAQATLRKFEVRRDNLEAHVAAAEARLSEHTAVASETDLKLRSKELALAVARELGAGGSSSVGERREVRLVLLLCSMR